MKLLWDNPEFVRNARIQLRPGRIVAAIVGCLAISGTIWASIAHSDVDVSIDGLHKAGAVFAFTLSLQIAILLIGGGIFVLQSVHREKELNTFDFQRVTRLNALELTVGKLFGAPIGAYFVVLCFLPVALLGAVLGHVSTARVVESFAILLLGSIAFHCFALLVSVVEGRGAGAAGIIVYLAAVMFTAVQFNNIWSIRILSPFVAVMSTPRAFQGNDLFFGYLIPHFRVLMVLYVVFSAWFLLATVRNIKREPSLYEVYSPPQALSFALFLSVLLVGFYPWKNVFFEGFWQLNGPILTGAIRHQAAATQGVEQILLWWVVWLFAAMALVILRNREQIRRRLQNTGASAAGLWAALWPAPYVVLGVALVGGSVVGLIDHYRYAGESWSWTLAIYDVAFVAVWLSRDALCIQWLGLRRAKRPLATAALYFVIFYGCTATLFSALNLYATARGAALTAVLLPSPLFALNEGNWEAARQIWVIALFAQAAELAVFSWLQRRRLLEFQPVKTSPSISEETQLQSA